MTKKQKILAVKTPAVINHLAAIQTKFKHLKELRAKITQLKSLYAEHDQLMQELLPLFINVTPSEFRIQREVVLGSEVYKFTPHFYDTKKGLVLSKVWKSTAFESGAIE